MATSESITPTIPLQPQTKRERGSGRVFLRGSTWWVSYYLRGREHRESARTSDEQKAEKFLKHRLREVAADLLGARPFVSPKQQRLTVSDLLNGLERDLRLRGKLDTKSNSNFEPLHDYFGDMRAVDLTTEVIGKYIENMLAQSYARATVNRYTQRIGQAFRLAMRHKQLNEAPFIPRLSEIGNERTGFFEPEDFQAVVEHLPDYLQDFARFAYITGWRRGAVISLAWTDVGDDVIYLQAKNSKTRKPESIPLEGELAEIIERRRAAMVTESAPGVVRFAEHVFHRDGRRLGDFRKSWASACKKAGLTGKLFHDLRRTASKNMLAAGVPQAVAMRITGHRTDSIFRRYAIVDEAQKRQALASTQQYLSAARERKIAVMAARGGK
jgi:integrase